MSNFSKLVKHLETGLQRFANDLSDVLTVFGKLFFEKTKSFNTKAVDGTKTNNLALANHEHDYLPRSSAAQSTLRVNGLPVEDLALKNHTHDFVKYSDLRSVTNTDVPMIPTFYRRFSQVVPLNSNNVLTDNTSYYIIATPDAKGLKFMYGQALVPNAFVQLDLVSSKTNYTAWFVLRISGADIRINVQAGINSCRLSVAGQVYEYSAPSSTLRVRIEKSTNPRIVVRLENGQELVHSPGGLGDFLEFISVEAASPENALIRLNSPDIYILEPDETKLTQARYYKTVSAQRLNYRSKESFALRKHHHDGVHERNISEDESKRVCRSANFYALEDTQVVYEGDTVQQANTSSLYHPLDLFALARHSHFEAYARRNKRVMKAAKIYTNRGLVAANMLAKREHSHEYVSAKDKSEYAVKPDKALVSAPRIQRLRGTLVRYIQQFKKWTRDVSFYSAKHIPRNIFGSEVFPDFLPSNDMYLTNSPEYWPSQPNGCRAGAYGPNVNNILNTTIVNRYLKLETFWEGANNPTSRLTFRFAYTTGAATSKTYTPSRFHIAYVSKQTYEYIVKRARGRLITDSSEPTVVTTPLTFYESILTSAEEAKSNVLNVMPTVITATDGAYWVAVLPSEPEQSDDAFDRILNFAAAFIDKMIYVAFSLLLTYFGILQFTALLFHKFVVDFIGSLAYSVAEMSDTAFCVSIPLVFGSIVVTIRNDILNLANTIWNAGVDYLVMTFFVPSISIKYVDGLHPVVFYRTRPSPQYSSSNSDLYDPYPLNPLYPDEFPGTIGVNQGYGTTIGRLQVPYTGTPEFVFAAPFMASANQNPVQLVDRFASNYLKYFAILGRFRTSASLPYSARIGSTNWAALLSVVPYSAQEVNFGVLPSRGAVTVINCGHPFNLLILGKEE